MMKKKKKKRQCSIWNQNTSQRVPEPREPTVRGISPVGAQVVPRPLQTQLQPSTRSPSPTPSQASMASSRIINFTDAMKRQVLEIFLKNAENPKQDSKPGYSRVLSELGSHKILTADGEYDLTNWKYDSIAAHFVKFGCKKWQQKA